MWSHIPDMPAERAFVVGTIAQIVALTCHLNARNRGITAGRFFPHNSTCQFCEWVRFIRMERGWFSAKKHWNVISSSPDHWMDSTISRGFTRALLVYSSVNDPRLSDRMSVGFIGGGGNWTLCIERDDNCQAWQARWELGNRDARDSRIWRVKYAFVGERGREEVNFPSVPDAASGLRRALREIENFARTNNTGFTETFAKAEQCLENDIPDAPVYHRDLAPEGALPPPAARLLAACQAAWVFGGMGTWNDRLFEGEQQTEYERVSEQLFNALNVSICAAANASATE